MSAQSEQRSAPSRSIERDLRMRPLLRYRVSSLTVVLIPALWLGITDVFSTSTTVILIGVALVLGVTMFVLWSTTFLQLDRGTLRMRRYGRLREIPIAELGYPDRREGRSLVVRAAGGRKAFTLYDHVWSSDELDTLARELIARRSSARAAG